MKFIPILLFCFSCATVTPPSLSEVREDSKEVKNSSQIIIEKSKEINDLVEFAPENLQEQIQSATKIITQEAEKQINLSDKISEHTLQIEKSIAIRLKDQYKKGASSGRKQMLFLLILIFVIVNILKVYLKR